MATFLTHEQLLPAVLGRFVDAQLGTGQEALGAKWALGEKKINPLNQFNPILFVHCNKAASQTYIKWLQA